MKKQGFTLIELMVVIVIMGILAAVAVPKLFGMIAKSKASEVGPAAGTYVKLQDAYFSEKNKFGGWDLIGYVAPGGSKGASSESNNFEYNAGAVATNSIEDAGNKIGWKAKNLAKLNDCSSGYNWDITLGSISDATTVSSYTANVTGTACKALTPTFDQIGK